MSRFCWVNGQLGYRDRTVYELAEVPGTPDTPESKGTAFFTFTFQHFQIVRNARWLLITDLDPFPRQRIISLYQLCRISGDYTEWWKALCNDRVGSNHAVAPQSELPMIANNNRPISQPAIPSDCDFPAFCYALRVYRESCV